MFHSIEGYRSPARRQRHAMPKKRFHNPARGRSVVPGVPGGREPADTQDEAGPQGDIRAIVNALPALVGYWDRDLRYRWANNAYMDYFGLRPEEIAGRHVSEIVGPQLFERTRPHMDRALAGEPQLFDSVLVDPAGADRYTQVSYTPDVVDGEVRGVFVLVTDITTRRHCELALAAAEARFRLAFAGSPVGIGILNATGRLLEANPALCDLLGYAGEELRERAFADLVSPELRRQERERVADLLAGQPAPPSAERQLLRKDGSAVWVIVSVALANSGSDGLGIVHVQDISDRKATEDALRSSRERLAEAERVAQIGSLEWDIRNDEIAWSDGMFRIYGLTPDRFDPTFEGAANRTYPEDRALFRQTIERAITARSSYVLEYRTVRPDGRVRTLHSRAEIIVDGVGEPIRLVGIVQDITEAKLAQETLQSTSADLERRVMEPQKLALQTPGEPPVKAHTPLTSRELDVLQLVAQGLTNAAIAERLFVTEGTVKWHIKQILAKTGASNRAEAVARVLGATR